MDNRRKILGWGLVIGGGVVGITSLCLLVNCLLYLANIRHLGASQDVPLESKLMAIFCLLLPLVLLGVGGVIGGWRILRPAGKADTNTLTESISQRKEPDDE